MLRFFQKRLFLFISLFLLVCLLLCGYAYYLHPITVRPLLKGSVSGFNEGWSLATGDPDKPLAVSLPYGTLTPAKEDAIFTHVLPETRMPLQLAFLTGHCFVAIDVDGVRLYGGGERQSPGLFNESGMNTLIVTIPSGREGRLLTVTVSPSHVNQVIQLSSMIFGTQTSVSAALLRDIWSPMFTCFTLFLAGMVMLVFALVERCQKTSGPLGTFWLGLFILASAAWLATDSPLVQFFFLRNTQLVNLASFFLFTLLPLPFLRFLRGVVKHNHTAIDVLCLVGVLNCIMQILCPLLGITPSLWTLLPITHLLLGLSILVVIALLLLEQLKYKHKGLLLVSLALYALIISSFLALLSFKLNRVDLYAALFRCGLLLFMMFLCLSVAKQNAQMARDNALSQAYRIMAYLDPMTKLGNRAAFENRLTSLENDPPQAAFLGFAMLDLNHLKLANDTYGHAMGDRLIKAAADLTVRAFKGCDAQCYRIGGDEFAVVLRKPSTSPFPEVFARLDKLILAHNAANGEPFVSLSYGWASSTEALTPAQMQALLREADDKMYTHKRDTHNAR
ncbi:MAG: GGDEF domain-containing protein [Clostridia bacterium]